MIVKDSFTYSHDGTVLEGLLVRDDAQHGLLPGILLIHEFTGLGSYMLPHAERLARMGYVVLLADMYGKGIRPKDKGEASTITRMYRNDRELMRRRAQAGLDALSAVDSVDKKTLYCMGFSFGGCTALEAARSGADLCGAVSFYGYLNTTLPTEQGAVKGRILVLHGAHDKVVLMDEIPVFEKEMSNAGVEHQIIVYPDAGHGFANASHDHDPGTGSWYCEETSALAWAAVEEFLAAN